MDSLEQVNLVQEKVVAFLTPLVPLVGCHMVDFLTLGHWDTLLPPQLQQDLLSLPSDTLHLLPSAALPHTPDKRKHDSDEPWSLSSSDLSSFLSQVRRHLPAALGVTTPAEQILGEYGSGEISVLAMKGIMSLKKTHEVDTMAQVIARLAKGLGVGWLVDLGSGRGYLSTSLVLQYGLSVVAIDSSTANTTSALVRNNKLKRWWDNLRRTWMDRAEGRPLKKGKKARRKKTPSSPQQQQKQRQEDREDEGNQGDKGKNQKDREDKYQEEREDRNQKERAGKNQGGREEDREQEERDGRKQDREEKDTNQEDRKQGNVDQEYRKENKKQKNRSQIIRKQENVNQEERKPGNIQNQEDREREEERQEEKAKQEKQGSTQSQEHRKEERKQEDEGKQDMTPWNKNISEGQSALPFGHYIGVTKFITEDTDLLEVVRSAIRSETVTEGGGNRDESGVGIDDETQPCASFDTTSVDARQISNTANETAGIYSPNIASTTHTTNTNKNTNSRKQVDIENSRYQGISSPATTHTNTTVRNTNTTPSPSTGNTTYHCNTSYTTSNTNSEPPPPPDSPQDPTSMLTVDEASTLGLVGLHTCGNLASSSLRLFVSNPRVAFLCNVGCCYHLLEEEFSRNTYNQQKIQVDDGLSEKVECECVSGCRNEVEVLAAIEQENYALKSSTDDRKLKKTDKLTPKEKCALSCGNKVEVLEGIKHVNYAFKSSKSHTEQIEKTLLTHKGSSEERRMEETGVVAAAKEENKSTKSSKDRTEQEEKAIRQTHKEEKRLSGCKEEMKVLEIKQENGAVESSTGHLEQDKCRTKSLPPVNKEISAEEHEVTKQYSTLTKDDCSFSKSSTSNTEEREKSDINGTMLRTEGKEKNHSNKSPPLEFHSPPDTRERTHKGNRSSPPPSPPPQGHAKEEDNFNSPLQKPSSPFINTKTKTCKTYPSPPPPSSPRAQDGGGEGDIDPLHPSLIPNLGHGFPLSSFLRSKRFALGRNSRMLSSQAADRLTQGNIGGADSLYWRALLQVVLVDRLGDVSHLSHVGRLSAKCHTFPEYAQAALARLGVSLEVTEEELQEYDRKHSSSKDRLERFFLLRASLAAVVEGAVLLDRLAFLCEQDNVSAFLVPMFDPVTSPRCHALVAVRRRQRSTASDTLTPGKE